MAVGQVYSTPEEGWKQVNCNLSPNLFTYSNMNYGSDSNAASGGLYYPAPSGMNKLNYQTAHNHAYMFCNFTGTKIRIIGYSTNTSSAPEIASIYIDGNYVGKWYVPSDRSVGNIYKFCGYENTNLTNKEHTLFIVVEPESGRWHFDCLHIDENASVIKVNSLLEFNKNQFRAFTGVDDKETKKIKDGSIITAKYLEINPTVFGVFSDMKISNSPVDNDVRSGEGINLETKPYFDFYTTPEDPDIYELKGTNVVFKTTRDLKETDGVTETIDPSKYQEVIDVDYTNKKLSVVPKNVILKSKTLIPVDNTFSGVKCTFTNSDQSIKYLVSLDNENFFTYDATGATWVAASIDEIDEKGIRNFYTIPYADIVTFFGGYDKVGIAMKLYVEDPEDVAFYSKADRKFSGFKFTTGDPALCRVESCVRDVNFYVNDIGGSYNGNEKSLICDTVLSKGINWTRANDLNRSYSEYSASDVITNIGYDMSYSEYDVQVALRLLTTEDYNTYVLDPANVDKFNPSKDVATWVDNGANLTNNADFNALGDSTLTITHDTADKNTVYNNIGIRPQLFFNTRSKTYHRFDSETYLPVVRKVKDLEPGKAIACSYTATTSGVAAGAEGFAIGKNGKSLLPDYGLATPDGYFYFICVGYALSGALKCIADRVIQTNISWEALNDKGYCVTSGVSLKFGSAKNCLLRLPNTVSENTSGWENLGEWDACISYYGQHGINPSSNAVWNAASRYSWTLVTPQGAMANRIVRGYQDETNVADVYAQNSTQAATYGGGTDKVSTYVGKDVGFRPVIEIQTYVDESQITTYPECYLDIAPSIGACKPGQAIVCEYRQDTANVAGAANAFNFNPDSAKDPIADPAPNTPNGKFYFVCVGYAPSGAKKFVADRNIQCNVSWEDLNDKGYCVTSGVDVSEQTGFEKSLMRLMVSDVTNYNMRLESSEWDAIIMRENIGNTDVSAAGCNYWNMKKSLSWMLNTPHDVNASGNMGTMSQRVVRGKETIDYGDEANFISESTTRSASIGFRPVLEVRIEGKSAYHNCMINTTRVSEKNSENLFIGIDGSYEFFDEAQTVANASMTMFINNDIENLDFNPEMSDEDHTYHYDLPITKLEYGDNIIKIVLSTFTRGTDKSGNETIEDKVDNEFEYHIFKEYLKKPECQTKMRELESYTAGFDMGNGLTIESNTVVNNGKVKSSDSPEEILIPANTIKITFSAE